MTVPEHKITRRGFLRGALVLVSGGVVVGDNVDITIDAEAVRED